MNTHQAQIPAAIVLAQLLGRLEASTRRIDAHQYQVIAQRLAALLADTSVDWLPLLEHSPTAAQLYENLHYATGGLCCSPSDPAAQAKADAHRVIESARRKPSTGTTGSRAAEA